MKKEKIIQFVGFITLLESELFIPKWRETLHLLGKGHVTPRLHEQESTGKNRFRYISLHEWPDESFDFITRNGRRAEHFPEQNVRVMHAGGYIALPGNGRRREEDGELKLFAFISHNETDISYYRDLSPSANIYQAYYESCTHGYIIEYPIPVHLAEQLTAELKKRPGIEICLCRTSGKLQPA